MIETEDFTITFTGEVAEFIRTVVRRIGVDPEQYIIDGLWEDYKHDAYCLWEEDARTKEHCARCEFAEYCEDAISGEGE